MTKVKGAWKRGTTYFVRVPTQGGAVWRTTGNSNPRVIRHMRRMLEELGPHGERAWDLLRAVVDGRCTLADLYDAYAGNALDNLRARLEDTDLSIYLDPWEATVRSNKGDTGTAETYRRQVGTLIVSGFARSKLTDGQVIDWLTGLSVSPGTRRKYLYALFSFCKFLKGKGVIKQNPARDIEKPKKNPPRIRYEELQSIKALVMAQPEPFRTLSAFIHATAAEISAALAVKRRDIDLARRLAHIPGTKTASRDRHEVDIWDWAMPLIDSHCQALLPNALLFPGIDRYRAYAEHKKACILVGIEDYTMHDARHSWAVMALRAGASLEVVRRQLGHANTTQVTAVYGRFVPTYEERTGWQRIAALQAETATNGVTSAMLA